MSVIHCPALAEPGRRQDQLNLLARKTTLLRRGRRFWRLANQDGPTPGHPVWRSVQALLSERGRMRVNVDWENDKAWVDRIFLIDPSQFGEDDFEVVVRCMFLNDRGIGRCGIGGDTAQRSEFLEGLIRVWDRPLTQAAPSLWSQRRLDALRLPSFVHALDEPGWSTATVSVLSLGTSDGVNLEIVRDDGQWAAVKLRTACRAMFEPFPYPGWDRIHWPHVSFKVLRDGAMRPRKFDSYYQPWTFYPGDVVTRLFREIVAYVDVGR